MAKVNPIGKQYVLTEPGEALNVSPMIAKLALPNGTFAQVKRAYVDAASNATTELIPADAGLVFRVLNLVMLHGGTAGTVTFKSGTDAISCTFSNAANGGMVLPFNTAGWLQTLDVDKALNVTVSTSSACGVLVNYIEVPADCFDLL